MDPNSRAHQDKKADRILFEHPSLSHWKVMLVSLIEKYPKSEQLLTAFHVYCNYLMTMSPIEYGTPQGKKVVKMLQNIAEHSNPIGFAEAVVLLQSKALNMPVEFNKHLTHLLQDNPDPKLITDIFLRLLDLEIFSAQALDVNLLLRVKLWFDYSEIQQYFQCDGIAHLPKAFFGELLAISGDNAQQQSILEIQLKTACIISSFYDQTPTNRLLRAYTLLIDAFDNGLLKHVLNNALLKIPRMLSETVHPIKVINSIIRFGNAAIFLEESDKAKADYQTFIQHARLWFDEDTIYQAFQSLHSDDIGQGLFDQLVFISQKPGTRAIKRGQIIEQLTNRRNHHIQSAGVKTPDLSVIPSKEKVPAVLRSLKNNMFGFYPALLAPNITQTVQQQNSRSRFNSESNGSDTISGTVGARRNTL